MTRNKKAPSAAVHEGSGAGTVRIIGGQWRGRGAGSMGDIGGLGGGGGEGGGGGVIEQSTPLKPPLHTQRHAPLT